MDDSCVFCGLLGGDGPAVWIWRGEAASALVPKHSDWTGHTLVISNEHAVGVQDASPSAMHAVAGLVQQVAQRMGDAFHCTGVNILNASGPGSGQSVDHLHFHVVPKWGDDGMDLWPHSQQSSHELDGEWSDLLRAELAR
ncbi:HIT domain-containing protein [Allobranchiibius sp. CTAmp26]|nr:HIT domain-containing protein [Allobranchiibius sp. CTAmp26]